MITCSIMGGVGNQLFQIAFAYATAKRSGRECILLDNQFDGAGQGRNVATYYNTIFRKIKRCTPYFAERFQIDERQFGYHSIQDDIINAPLPANSLIIAKGYFQSELYFPKMRDELKKLFLPDEGTKSYLRLHTAAEQKYPELFGETDNLCFIGVRRGDYLKHSHIHNPCDFSYYEDAMRRVSATKYYIASDDIEWCKENFRGPQFVFFDIADDLEQLFVATLFSKYIIANSSYHWWASYLSQAQDPLIIAPDKWITLDKPNDTYMSIYRPEMIILSRNSIF